jgi:hypothetical protein
MVEMQKQYNFNPRSNSFLDSDSKLQEKFLLFVRIIDYSKLVSINLDIKNKTTELRRLYSHKQEEIKKSIIIQDIIKA